MFVQAHLGRALEQRWLEEERRHGLPVGRRQKPVVSSGRRMFRDVEYEGLGCVVELDGRLGHDTTEDRDRDFERDLDAAVDRLETVRLSYGQVLARGCSTAEKMAKILRRRGWDGQLMRCRACPATEIVVDRAGHDRTDQPRCPSEVEEGA